MSERSSREQMDQLKRQFSAWLRHPLHLRGFVTFIVVIIGYTVAFAPLAGNLDAAVSTLRKQETRRDQAQQVEQMRAEVERFRHRLPKDADANEWAKYVLTGLREFPLKLLSMVTDSPRRVGNFQAVVLKVTVHGEFEPMAKLVQWLETNERLFRIDSISLQEARTGGLSLELTILGLMG